MSTQQYVHIEATPAYERYYGVGPDGGPEDSVIEVASEYKDLPEHFLIDIEHLIKRRR